MHNILLKKKMILHVLYMNMQKYELRYDLLVHCQPLKFRMFYSKTGLAKIMFFFKKTKNHGLKKIKINKRLVFLFNWFL